MMRLKLAAAWIGLQVLFFAGWAGLEEMRLAPGEGRSILVRTVPVDPRDLLRGQYIRLAYEFSTGWPTQAGFPDGAEVWAVLSLQGEFHGPRDFSERRPDGLAPGEVALRGRVERWRLRFGIEEYFVPEGTETPAARDLTVRLRVGNDGRARIEQVYVKGVPWP